MDSQHRHELQQNDLAEFISHFQDWWEAHGFRTLLYVLVILAVVFGIQMVKANKKAAHDEMWFELSAATSPAAYESVARTHQSPTVRALARLRGADLALNRALGRKAPESAVASAFGELSTPVVEDTTADQSTMLTEAEQGYRAVIDMTDAPLDIRLNAYLGLASVEETRRAWDAARQVYKQVEDLAGNGYELFAETASHRTKAIERIAEPIVLGKDPEPEPELEVTSAAPTETPATESQAPTTQPAAGSE